MSASKIPVRGLKLRNKKMKMTSDMHISGNSIQRSKTKN